MRKLLNKRLVKFGPFDMLHEHPEVLKPMDLGYLAANLNSIAFYDLIIVFDEKKRVLPKSELR